MDLSDAIKRAALQRAYEFLDRDPDTNLPKLVDWLERADRYGSVSRQLPGLKSCVRDPSSNWYQLIRSLWDDVDGGVRRSLFTNIVVNGSFLAAPRLAESRESHGCGVPWALHLAPGPAESGLGFDELDGVIEQGKALGTFFYLYTGPALAARQKDLLALGNKHSDCQFVLFLGGERIDEALAEDLLRVKNLLPALVLGPEDLAAASAASGAMDLLRRKKLPFGAACRCTDKTAAALGGEDFFDALIDRGAKFAVFFTQMPLEPGDAPASSAARARLHRRLCQFRKTKPLFTVDLCGDAALLGGCAGKGRCICHIDGAGNLRPCALVRRGAASIREKTLLEAYRSLPLSGFGGGLSADCPLADREPEPSETSN